MQEHLTITSKQMSGPDKVSVFGGTGFVGENYVSMFDSIIIPRESRIPQTNDILYFISTTHNYHVFDDPTLDVKTNLVVLTEVLNNLKRGSIFNFVSSWFVYGDTELPAKETYHKNPKGFYSITKSCAEDLVISFCKTHKIDYRILRLSNIYGIGDKKASKKKNALQFLINQIKEDKQIGLYHGGDFVRDYLHVEDACKAINLILNKGNKNEIFNIGSGNAYKFLDLMKICYDELGKNQDFYDMEPPEFHQLVQVKDMYLDNSKLKNLGFTPDISIEDGLRKLCNTKL